MGKRGPAKKPTAIRLVQNNPGKRPLNPDEPDFPPADVKSPEKLTGRAREIWGREAPRLIQAGVMTQADRLMFAAACQRYSDYEYYRHMVDKHGELVTSPNGYPMPSPYIAMRERALKDYLAIAKEFGLTPSSRTNVKAHGKQKKESKFFQPPS